MVDVMHIFWLKKEDFKELYSKFRISGIVGNVRIYENSLIIQKYFRTPLKRGKKVFIPHENVAKYFDTPPRFTPPRYPALKMTGP